MYSLTFVSVQTPWGSPEVASLLVEAQEVAHCYNSWFISFAENRAKALALHLSGDIGRESHIIRGNAQTLYTLDRPLKPFGTRLDAMLNIAIQITAWHGLSMPSKQSDKRENALRKVRKEKCRMQSAGNAQKGCVKTENNSPEVLARGWEVWKREFKSGGKCCLTPWRL